MIDYLKILNSITKTIEIAEKTLPLVKNYGKNINNVYQFLNTKYKNKTIKETKIVTNKKEVSTSTLTFFQ